MCSEAGAFRLPSLQPRPAGATQAVRPQQGTGDAGDVEIVTALRRRRSRSVDLLWGDARRLQQPAFRLPLDSIRSARPAAVTTTAMCALSAQKETLGEVFKVRVKTVKQDTARAAREPAAV